MLTISLQNLLAFCSVEKFLFSSFVVVVVRTIEISKIERKSKKKFNTYKEPFRAHQWKWFLISISRVKYEPITFRFICRNTYMEVNGQQYINCQQLTLDIYTYMVFFTSRVDLFIVYTLSSRLNSIENVHRGFANG